MLRPLLRRARRRAGERRAAPRRGAGERGTEAGSTCGRCSRSGWTCAGRRRRRHDARLPNVERRAGCRSRSRPAGGPRRRSRARGSARRPGRSACHAVSRVAERAPRLRARSRTSSRRASPASSAGSTRAASRPPRRRTSRTRATTSGGCCTTAGFTPRLFDPQEQFELLELGYGVTNAAVPHDARLGRPAARRLRPRRGFERRARELRPRAIAFVGKEAYRGLFGERARARSAAADASARPASSSCRRPRRRTRPCRTRSGCAGSASCAPGSSPSRASGGARASCSTRDERVLLVRVHEPP